MSYKFEVGDTVYWVTKTKAGEAVSSGEVLFRTNKVRESDVNVRKLIPSIRYGVKVENYESVPLGWDVHWSKQNPTKMEISETRLFSSLEEAHKNIQEWALTQKSLETSLKASTQEA